MKRTLETSGRAVDEEGRQLKLGRARGADWAELLQSPLVCEELAAAVARCVAHRAKAERGWPTSPDTIAFLKELSQTLEPVGLRLVLDGFARARAEEEERLLADVNSSEEEAVLATWDEEPAFLFHGVVGVGVEDIDLLSEASVSGLTNELVVEVSHLLLEHEAAGPQFFEYGFFLTRFQPIHVLEQGVGLLFLLLAAALVHSCHRRAV
jgi:hypothetical protein